MLKKTLAVALASLLVTSISSAAVLDGDDAVVSASSGKFKDWGLSFFSLASRKNMQPGIDDQKEKEKDRSIFAYNYFSVNYKVDATQRYSLRLPFGYTSAGYDERGENKTEEFQMQDIHFVYSNYDLGYVGDVDLSGKVKFYLPTSKSTLDKKSIGYIRLEGYADYVISRNWSIAYIVKPDIYLQTQTSYYNSNTDRFSRTKQYELEHYAQLQWDATSYLTFQASAGFAETWEHESAAQNLKANHFTAFKYGGSAWYTVQRGLMFTLSVENETEIGSIRGDGARYSAPENTNYVLLTNWAIL
jgi:hypothetical protein